MMVIFTPSGSSFWVHRGPFSGSFEPFSNGLKWPFWAKLLFDGFWAT